MKIRISYQKGITILETLIAIAILSLLVVIVASYLTTLKKGERRMMANQEVDAAASDIMQTITQSARNATSITFPATSTAATRLTLAVPNIPAENPTSYTLVGGKVFMKKGTAATTTITSDKVTIDSMTFTNLSAATTRGTIRAALTASYGASSTTLQTSVSLR